MPTERPLFPARCIVVDLEATCWAGVHDPGRMETIEIGAVRLDGAGQPTRDEFSRCVRPVAEPTLSDFCRGLTGITQAEVDAAEPFPAAFAEFLRWAGSPDFTWGSWGAYDLRQLRTDCDRHRIEWPARVRHVNIKQLYAKRCGGKARGMK